MAYSWSSMGVPAAELQRVASVCGELLGQKLALGPAPLPAQQPPAAAQQPPAAPQQPPPHQQPLQQQHKRPPPCSPGSLARAAAAEQCGAAAADAPPEGAPADLSERLSAAGYTIRVLKEQLGLEDVSYGRLRLALAHLTRCNPALP